MGLFRRDSTPSVLIGWGGKSRKWSLSVEPSGTEYVLRADESVELRTEALATDRVEIIGHEDGVAVWLTSDDEVSIVTLKGKKLPL